jgi:hypothetical protein
MGVSVWTWFFWYKSFKETGCESVDLILWLRQGIEDTGYESVDLIVLV